MSKIKVAITINNNETSKKYETTAILDGNILKYKEEDTTTVIYNYKNNELLRENNDLRLNIIFQKNKETKGNMYIKDIDKELNISVNTKKIIKRNNNIEIEYYIDNNHFLYRIEEIK